MADKSIIKDLEVQIANLLSDHKRIYALNSSLNQQKAKLLAERRALQEQVTELTNELSALRLSQALGGQATDRDKSRARINHLMREVDKCIALLNAAKE